MKKMERSINYFVLLLVLGHFLCSGSSRTQKEEGLGHVDVLRHDEEKQDEFKASKFTTQKDITTPITTIPNLVPITSTNPILNPNSNPDTFSPISTLPITTTPSSMPNNSPVSSSSGASWCTASPTASQRALQVALDYACGYGGTDCSAIQPGGSCYFPNSVRDHASYAFNKYYQKNPVPNSCNFGGAAVITSTNPSTGACQFTSTSISSSVLNTTNTSGANVFGSVPVPKNPSSASATGASTSARFVHFCLILWSLLAILDNNYL